jgi:hypothetical protein
MDVVPQVTTLTVHPRGRHTSGCNRDGWPKSRSGMLIKPSAITLYARVCVVFKITINLIKRLMDVTAYEIIEN